MKLTCALKQDGISDVEYILFRFLFKKLSEFLSTATIARCGKPQVLILSPSLHSLCYVFQTRYVRSFSRNLFIIQIHCTKNGVFDQGFLQ